VPWVVQVAIILSTLGAALQSLTGAPRLLAAIANDDIIPVLKYFKAPDDVEPDYATLVTMIICFGCVVLGNLDLISPVTTMFFLLCYGGVNLSCFLLDLLDAPSWRPRFKFHHWSLSLLGALLCISKFCSFFIYFCHYFLHVLYFCKWVNNLLNVLIWIDFKQML
jgi:potassium/chloride transporter 4/5/6